MAGGMEEEGEQAITMSEYFEQLEAQELEADLVLGGDDGKECTFSKGYMPRQAVFSCLSCTPHGNAGVCTACSIRCHDGHEVVELWTRRHFRCDCGNSKFGAGICRLYGGKDVENSENTYNQNYKGIYCTCKRPYPDPDGEDQGEMLQCCICEDWFHENHIGLGPTEQIPKDEEGETFDELVCQACAGRLQFLAFYEEVQPLSDLKLGSCTVEVNIGNEEAEKNREGCLSSETIMNHDAVHPAASEFRSLNSKISSVVEIHKALENGCTEAENQGSSGEHKSINAVNTVESCNLEQKKLEKGKKATEMAAGEGCSKRVVKSNDRALFMSGNWRTELCQCNKCLNLYSINSVTFLLDPDDTLHKYEEVATQRRKEKMEADEGAGVEILKTLGHVGQIEFLHKVNDMADEMASFFESFNESGRAVTSADVQEFFDHLKQKKRRVE